MRTDKVKLIIEGLFLILFCRLIFMQIIAGNYFYSLSKKNCIRVIPSAGARGRILDHNKNIIVDSHLSYNISVLAQEFRRNKDTLYKLASLLDRKPSEINKIIRKDFISSFTPIAIDRDTSRGKAILIEENKFQLPGVIVQLVPKRNYPYGGLASHVIGYLSQIDSWRLTRLKDYGYKLKDTVGVTGVEEMFDSPLRAQDGGMQIQVDHKGRLNKVIGFREPTDGMDLRLTLELKIQKIVEEEFAGKKGAAVFMAPSSGRIIALASSPGFLPEKFLDKDSSSYVSSVISASDSPMVNRAVSGQYPLGSVFKIISTISALEQKKITPDKRFICTGRIAIGNRIFNCMETHNSQNLAEAIAHSCNIYFYRLAILLGPDLLTEYSLKLGLGKPTGIDLYYESYGYVPSALAAKIKLRPWYDGDTANFGIGQGELLVVPIQAARLMAAVVNGGKLVRPYIVEALGEKEIARAPVVEDLRLDEANLKIVRDALRQVVASETGTAHLLDFPDFHIAGKTGTAQVSGKSAHGWFVGFAPFENPKFVFCIFLENCGSSAYAVMTARQIFQRMIDEGLV